MLQPSRGWIPLLLTVLVWSSVVVAQPDGKGWGWCRPSNGSLCVSDNRPCRDTFTHRGYTFDTCTRFDNSGDAWCYDDDSWSTCTCDDLSSPMIIDAAGPALEGTECHFPYVHEGHEYDNCTTLGWCANAYVACDAMVNYTVALPGHCPDSSLANILTSRHRLVTALQNVIDMASFRGVLNPALGLPQLLSLLATATPTPTDSEYGYPSEPSTSAPQAVRTDLPAEMLAKVDSMLQCVVATIHLLNSWQFPSAMPIPPSTCPGYDNYLSDGYCDSATNNANCLFDGGDCCEETCRDGNYRCSVDPGDCIDTNVVEPCGNPLLVDAGEFLVGVGVVNMTLEGIATDGTCAGTLVGGECTVHCPAEHYALLHPQGSQNHAVQPLVCGLGGWHLDSELVANVSCFHSTIDFSVCLSDADDLGDGWCDSWYNSPECEFDGGDCCQDTWNGRDPRNEPGDGRCKNWDCCIDTERQRSCSTPQLVEDARRLSFQHGTSLADVRFTHSNGTHMVEGCDDVPPGQTCIVTCPMDHQFFVGDYPPRYVEYPDPRQYNLTCGGGQHYVEEQYGVFTCAEFLDGCNQYSSTDPTYFRLNIGNDYCNAISYWSHYENTQECAYDGGDCCPHTSGKPEEDRDTEDWVYCVDPSVPACSVEPVIEHASLWDKDELGCSHVGHLDYCQVRCDTGHAIVGRHNADMRCLNALNFTDNEFDGLPTCQPFDTVIYISTHNAVDITDLTLTEIHVQLHGTQGSSELMELTPTDSFGLRDRGVSTGFNATDVFTIHHNRCVFPFTDYDGVVWDTCTDQGKCRVTDGDMEQCDTIYGTLGFPNTMGDLTSITLWAVGSSLLDWPLQALEVDYVGRKYVPVTPFVKSATGERVPVGPASFRDMHNITLHEVPNCSPSQLRCATDGLCYDYATERQLCKKHCNLWEVDCSQTAEESSCTAESHDYHCSQDLVEYTVRMQRGTRIHNLASWCSRSESLGDSRIAFMLEGLDTNKSAVTFSADVHDPTTWHTMGPDFVMYEERSVVLHLPQLYNLTNIHMAMLVSTVAGTGSTDPESQIYNSDANAGPDVYCQIHKDTDAFDVFNYQPQCYTDVSRNFKADLNPAFRSFVANIIVDSEFGSYRAEHNLASDYQELVQVVPPKRAVTLLPVELTTVTCPEYQLGSLESIAGGVCGPNAPIGSVCELQCAGKFTWVGTLEDSAGTNRAVCDATGTWLHTQLKCIDFEPLFSDCDQYTPSLAPGDRVWMLNPNSEDPPRGSTGTVACMQRHDLDSILPRPIGVCWDNYTHTRRYELDEANAWTTCGMDKFQSGCATGGTFYGCNVLEWQYYGRFSQSPDNFMATTCNRITKVPPVDCVGVWEADLQADNCTSVLTYVISQPHVGSGTACDVVDGQQRVEVCNRDCEYDYVYTDCDPDTAERTLSLEILMPASGNGTSCPYFVPETVSCSPPTPSPTPEFDLFYPARFTPNASTVLRGNVEVRMDFDRDVTMGYDNLELSVSIRSLYAPTIFLKRQSLLASGVHLIANRTVVCELDHSAVSITDAEYTITVQQGFVRDPNNLKAVMGRIPEGAILFNTNGVKPLEVGDDDQAWYLNLTLGISLETYDTVNRQVLLNIFLEQLSAAMFDDASRLQLADESWLPGLGWWVSLVVLPAAQAGAKTPQALATEVQELVQLSADVNSDCAVNALVNSSASLSDWIMAQNMSTVDANVQQDVSESLTCKIVYGVVDVGEVPVPLEPTNFLLLLAVLGGVIVLFVIFMLVIKRKYPESRLGPWVTLILSNFDFTTDILFAVGVLNCNVERNWDSCPQDSEKYLFFYLAAGFVVLPFVANFTALVWFFYREFAFKPFRDFFRFYQAQSTSVLLLSLTNIDSVAVLDSRLFHARVFTAPFSQKGLHHLAKLSVLTNVLEDLPQIIIQFVYWYQFEGRNTGSLTFTSLMTSVASLLMGITRKLLMWCTISHETKQSAYDGATPYGSAGTYQGGDLNRTTAEMAHLEAGTPGETPDTPDTEAEETPDTPEGEDGTAETAGTTNDQESTNTATATRLQPTGVSVGQQGAQPSASPEPLVALPPRPMPPAPPGRKKPVPPPPLPPKRD